MIAALRHLLRRLAAKRARRLDEMFAGYAATPTGLPGEAEAAARNVPAYLLRQRNAPSERPVPVLVFGGETREGWK